MTENEHNSEPPSQPERARGVIDPAWEDELRRGQVAEGEAGSVEAELALLHLLRHVRQPDILAPEQLDSLWSAIEAEVAPVAAPWWRQAWLWWSAPALAAAAVFAVIILDDADKAEDTIARTDERKAESNADRKHESAPAAAPEGAIGAGGLAFAEAEERAAAPSATGDLKAKSATRGAGSNAFEASFEQLAPHGRRAIRGSVDTSLDDLRGQLLADARGVSP